MFTIAMFEGSGHTSWLSSHLWSVPRRTKTWIGRISESEVKSRIEKARKGGGWMGFFNIHDSMFLELPIFVPWKQIGTAEGYSAQRHTLQVYFAHSRDEFESLANFSVAQPRLFEHPLALEFLLSERERFGLSGACGMSRSGIYALSLFL
jgi:hypothetical protein